mgnify:FL=1
MAEDNFDISKQLEGNSLALGAIADVLSKMDAKLSREEGVQIAKDAEFQKAAERDSLVADISKNILGMLKAEMGLTKGEADADDGAEKIKLPAPGTEEVQKPIEKAEEEDDEDIMEVMDEMEEKMDEDDDEEYGKKDVEKSLRKQIAALEKQLDSSDSRIEKAVKAESESRLRKMGFREETGLRAPQSRSLTAMGTQSFGVDEAPYISKASKQASTEDVVDQLASLSFRQLRDMQEKIESGDTEGIPKELLG